jgi:hypothetical protein
MAADEKSKSAEKDPAHKEKVSERLHGALHRGGKKVTEDELEAVTEVVLVVVAELVAEMVELIADLEVRVLALELG